MSTGGPYEGGRRDIGSSTSSQRPGTDESAAPLRNCCEGDSPSGSGVGSLPSVMVRVLPSRATILRFTDSSEDVAPMCRKISSNRRYEGLRSRTRAGVPEIYGATRCSAISGVRRPNCSIRAPSSSAYCGCARTIYRPSLNQHALKGQSVESWPGLQSCESVSVVGGCGTAPDCQRKLRRR